ncbi:MAG: HAD family hydrolase [Bacteroidota bacterium]
MQSKLICSDIDGTLLNKDRELSDKTITVIKDISPTPFILISSRMPKALTHLQEELAITNLPVIAYNGGLILDQNKVLHSTEIKHDVTENIFQFIKQTDLHLSLYHNDEWYVPSMDYWAKRESNNTKVIPQAQDIEITLKYWHSENKGAHKIMVMGDENEIDQLVSLIEKKFDDEIIGYRSKPTYLEISHRDISKKTAIEQLLDQKYPELSINNVLAFGDNYNDIEMLKSVGLGVAVQNSKKEVLQAANQITDSNIEDGVANFIENIISKN